MQVQEGEWDYTKRRSIPSFSLWTMSFTIAKRNKKPYNLILLGCFTEFNRFHGHFDNNRYILPPENSTFIGFYPLATETYVML